MGLRGLPEFLVANPGLNSGFMIPQYAAASMVNQNKMYCFSASSDSIVSHVRLAAAAPRPVRRVAVCGGAGADFIDDAVRRGADVYVTGDVKYHDAQRAVEQGMHIIDAGHFGTEAPVLPVLAEQLRTELASERGEIEIFVTNTQRDVFDVII